MDNFSHECATCAVRLIDAYDSCAGHCPHSKKVLYNTLKMLYYNVLKGLDYESGEHTDENTLRFVARQQANERTKSPLGSCT